MDQQLTTQIQKPTDFKYVTKHLGKTAYLSDLVRVAGSNDVFESEYFDVGLALQHLIASNSSLFLPLDSHIYEMIKSGKDANYEGTGSVLLIPGDKSFVNPIVNPRIKIKHPTWTDYGISHKIGGTPQNPKIEIFDESKLVETDIPLNTSKTVYPKRIENGKLIEVQDKSNPDHPRDVVWIDTKYKKEYDRQHYDYGVNPLRRGSELGHRGKVSFWVLGRRPSGSGWRSRLGSVESRTADRKRIFRDRLSAIPAQRVDQLPDYIRNLEKEFDELAQEL